MGRLKNVIGTLLYEKEDEFQGEKIGRGKERAIGAIRTSFTSPIKVGIKVIVSFSRNHIRKSPGQHWNFKISNAFGEFRREVQKYVVLLGHKISYSNENATFSVHSEEDAEKIRVLAKQVDFDALVWIDGEKESLEDGINPDAPRWKIHPVKDSEFLGRYLIEDNGNIHLFFRARGGWVDFRGIRHYVPADQWQRVCFFSENLDTPTAASPVEFVDPAIKTAEQIDRLIGIEFNLASYITKLHEARIRGINSLIAEINKEGEKISAEEEQKREKLEKQKMNRAIENETVAANSRITAKAENRKPDRAIDRGSARFAAELLKTTGKTDAELQEMFKGLLEPEKPKSRGGKRGRRKTERTYGLPLTPMPAFIPGRGFEDLENLVPMSNEQFLRQFKK